MSEHKPSRASQQAMHDMDTHTVAAQNTDAVPAPDEGGHAHSHAAHLHEAGKADTHIAGNNHLNTAPGALRQPPAEISRAGKQHRD